MPERSADQPKRRNSTSLVGRLQGEHVGPTRDAPVRPARRKFPRIDDRAAGSHESEQVAARLGQSDGNSREPTAPCQGGTVRELVARVPGETTEIHESRRTGVGRAHG